MSSRALRTREISGLQLPVEHWGTNSFRILNKQLQGPSEVPDNPAFRELALNDLGALLKPISLGYVLGVTSNQTFYGPLPKVRQTLLFAYEVFKKEFRRKRVSLKFEEDENPNNVLLKTIRAFDEIHPECAWEFVFEDNQVFITMERDYREVAPEGGYGFEIKPYVDIRFKNKLLFKTVFIMLNLLNKHKVCRFWDDVYPHEAAIEYLTTMIQYPDDYLNDHSKEDRKEIIQSWKDAVYEMENGAAAMFMSELEKFRYDIDDLKKVQRSWCRKKNNDPFKKLILSIVENCIYIITCGKCIGDFLHINSDDNPEYFEDCEPITMHDFMQVHWRFEGHYWEEVESHFDSAQQCGATTWGFSDKLRLTIDHPEIPSYDPFPGHMAQFFNGFNHLAYIVKEQYSPLLIHKL